MHGSLFTAVVVMMLPRCQPISLAVSFSRRPTCSRVPDPQLVLRLRSCLMDKNFTVQTPDAGRIAKVSLIRFGGVTHAENFSQRFLPLTFSVADSGSLAVTAPANANLAPPGYYMLFLVDTNGVPSIASIVHF
jgi:hypothetical protein